MKHLKLLPAIALCATLTFILSTRTLHALQSAPTQTQADSQSIHQVALKLLDAMGTRKVLSDNVDAMIENGKQKMLKQHTELDPAFVDEWARRMHTRINLDDFIAVIASIYEKHFTTAELTELTNVYNDVSANRTPQISDALKAKLNEAMPEVQADMGAGLMELSEKIGSEVAVSVAKDHPELVKTPPPSEPPTTPVPPTTPITDATPQK
jgi:hypothetical protein